LVENHLCGTAAKKSNQKFSKGRCQNVRETSPRLGTARTPDKGAHEGGEHKFSKKNYININRMGKTEVRGPEKLSEKGKRAHNPLQGGTDADRT